MSFIYGSLPSIKKGWKIYRLYPSRRLMIRDFRLLKGEQRFSNIIAVRLGGLNSKYPYAIGVKIK